MSGASFRLSEASQLDAVVDATVGITDVSAFKLKLPLGRRLHTARAILAVQHPPLQEHGLERHYGVEVHTLPKISRRSKP